MQKIKNFFSHVWGNKRFYLVIAVLLFVVYKLVVANYRVDVEIRKAEAETYLDVWNDRALCQQRYEQVKEIMDGYRDAENSFAN